MNIARRVVKVGGSLLASDECWLRLDHWLRRANECETILVLGGGAAVDAIRDLDRVERQDQVAIHWRCIELMRDNALLAMAELNRLTSHDLTSRDRQGAGGDVVDGGGESNERHRSLTVAARQVAVRRPIEWLESIHELPAVTEPGRCWMLDPLTFMRIDDPVRSPEPLPASWDVTSDSIAARLAQLISADELVLLKSTLPTGSTCAAWSTEEFVDRFFPQAAASLRRVRVVNLRSATFESRILSPTDA
jgi:aspartokinase-like uncharacterized kinase